jgi:dTDP-4-dehydrorhamnose reductase
MAAFLDANAVWPHRLAAATADAGCRLIHISSDGVFSGARGAYTEQDEPDPPNPYSMAKLLGEPAAAHVVTLRTSIIGPELGAGTGLLSWFLRQQGPVSGYSRWMFSGFTTLELSRLIGTHVLPDATVSGLFHAASPAISKFAMLNMLAKAYDHTVPITPDDTVVCDRTLDGSRFAERTGYFPPDWPGMIAAMRDFGA